MALRLETAMASVSSFTKTSSFLESQTLGASGALLCSNDRAQLVFMSLVRNRGIRRNSGERFVARISNKQAGLRSLLIGERQWLTSPGAASLASASHLLAFEHREAELRGVNPKDVLKAVLNPLPLKEDEDENGDATGTGDEEVEPGVEEGRTLVSEVILNGDDLSVVEYLTSEEAQPDANPLNAMADSLLNKLGDDGRGFSLTEVGGIWKTGEDAGEAKVPDMSVSGFDVKEGVDPLAQWTSIEITMQHSQLARIATDVRYLQRAFAFFGAVRVVEAFLSVYATSPPDYGKCKELLNALDPFTISWLAHNLRQPIEGIVNIDPLDLERVIALKSSVWEELHKFYERQWKVMATLAMARTLSIIASDVPAAEVVTSKVKFLWDALMALPVF